MKLIDHATGKHQALPKKMSTKRKKKIKNKSNKNFCSVQVHVVPR